MLRGVRSWCCWEREPGLGRVLGFGEAGREVPRARRRPGSADARGYYEPGARGEEDRCESHVRHRSSRGWRVTPGLPDRVTRPRTGEGAPRGGTPSPCAPSDVRRGPSVGLVLRPPGVGPTGQLQLLRGPGALLADLELAVVVLGAGLVEGHRLLDGVRAEQRARDRRAGHAQLVHPLGHRGALV